MGCLPRLETGGRSESPLSSLAIQSSQGTPADRDGWAGLSMAAVTSRLSQVASLIATASSHPSPSESCTPQSQGSEIQGPMSSSWEEPAGPENPGARQDGPYGTGPPAHRHIITAPPLPARHKGSVPSDLTFLTFQIPGLLRALTQCRLAEGRGRRRLPPSSV